jgi:Cu(I)/Ag(I) efflux system membrane fusion protein
MIDDRNEITDEPIDAGPARRRWMALGIALVVLAIVLVAFLWSPWRDRPSTGQPGAASTMEGMEGMDMSADRSVRLTADQIRQFGVTFGSVEERRLEREVRAAGAVTVDETRVTDVAPKFGGFADRLYVDFTGQSVRRGQPLADVYSPELLAAQQELISARALERTIGESSVPGVPNQSTDLVAAARRRLELWGVSEGQIENVLRSGRPTRTVTLYSPASGIVTAKNVVRGQAFQPGQTLYTIVDLSQVWVEAELREADVGAVRIGSGADLELAAQPGRAFKGRVDYIYPTLDTMARTIRARVVVANDERLLKPGMYAIVRITTPSRRALTVPSTAVVRTGDRSVVFVDMGRGRILPVEVETGVVTGELTEVLSGLEIGQRVVTSAQFLLDSESNLAEVMRAMMGQTGAQDAGNMPGMDMPGMPMPADTRSGDRP